MLVMPDSTVLVGLLERREKANLSLFSDPMLERSLPLVDEKAKRTDCPVALSLFWWLVLGVKETKKHPPRSSQISAVSSKYSLPSRFKSQPCVSTVSFSCKTQNDENPNHKSTPCKGRQGCPPDDRPDASGTSEKDARDKSKRWAPQRERDRSWGKRARGDRLEERQKKGPFLTSDGGRI